jgi:hypothetical protein
MEQNFDTSFIPKRPIFKEEANIRRHAPISVVALVGFAVFFAALILTGLAFFVHKKESDIVQSLATQLASEKERFNPQAIEDLKATSVRLKHAKQIVDNHVAASPLLDLVQSFTNKSVYYENLNLAKEEKTGYTLRLKGKAPSYGLLYAQVGTFRAETKLRTVEILNTQLDERTGSVDFDVTLVMKYIPPSVSATIPSVDTVAPVASSLEESSTTP